MNPFEFKAYLDAIPSGGWTLAGTAIGALLAHFLGKNKSQREKIWERRLEAYTLIVSSLERCRFHAENIVQLFEDAQAPDAAAVQAGMQTLGRELDKVVDAVEANRLLISDEFIEELERLMRAAFRERTEQPPGEYERQLLQDLRLHLPDLSSIAKREVRL